MLPKLWTFLVGSPLPTLASQDQRLSKIRALATFSPDALSSIAYANQEIYLGLVVAGSAGLIWSFPIGIIIAGLLCVVALSYFQTIHGYPSGGGSYLVARENLGVLPGLLAAAALMVDYVLNAAVSLTAGVEALASAFPELWAYRMWLALVLLALITWINLRGAKEAGLVISIPVYFFLIVYIGMLLYGLARALLEGPAAPVFNAPAAQQPVTLWLVLRALASGSTALTGIEAISNGVTSFRPPEARNAGRTLLVMAFFMAFLLLGSLGLTQYFAIVAPAEQTILSALAHRLVGNGFFYYLAQISTLLVLVVAANTSFAGFPRLASILAQDGYLPRPLANLGDRLVFNNGMLLLASLAAILIFAANGASHRLVPLFAVGAFLAFSLSQAGMVVHWLRLKTGGWRFKSILNSLGMCGTCLALVVVGTSKFVHGAWFTLLLIPGLVWIFYRIQAHYQDVVHQLSLHGLPPSLRPKPPLRVVIPISGVQRATIEAVTYARTLTTQIEAVYVEIEPGSAETVSATWQAWFPDVPLFVVQSPYRSIIAPLLDFLDQTDRTHGDGQLAAVLLPEIVPLHAWQSLLHNQVARLLRNALLYRRRQLGYTRLILDMPYHLRQ